MTTAAAVRKTALNETMRKAGGKMVDFHGWELPIQFEGILKEHAAVRNSAGLFDVSHMGRFVFRGPGSAVLLTLKTASALAARTRSIIMLRSKAGPHLREGPPNPCPRRPSSLAYALGCFYSYSTGTS